ncbi:MAG TPA: tRNA epoxyqueuosine(34) reductase QueG [Bryobacteraceae bacterium]|nr:tRNA epoxyqueuosine(34) reductase QueG [Bryobacteraceae bacterium]
MGLSDIERVPPNLMGDTNEANPPGRSSITGRLIRELALECGFDLVGVASASPVPDFGRFRSWVERGLPGEMRYLTDHRADVRGDMERVLPGVRSVICTGTMYNGPEPHSTEFNDPERAWISRYAWGDDYHDTIRAKLDELGSKLEKIEEFRWRSCIDTAPLLERSLGRMAGLGWIGKNTCLINQERGSWFFLGEILTTLELEPDSPPPDRCGTCTRCIDACPTAAIVPASDGNFELDARRCISYLTIELLNSIPERLRELSGNHIFGCDICQDVCPWNRRADSAAEPARSGLFAPPLERLAELTQTEFNRMFQGTPITRTKYRGFLRNISVAMGNSRNAKYRHPLERLALSEDLLVAEHARWALERIGTTLPEFP